MGELFLDALFNDANLKDYYRLEANSNDSKGVNNGTDTAITYNAGNGKFGQGAGFNGSTSKIVLPNLGVGAATARSISAWIKPTGVPSVQNTVFCYGIDAANTICGLHVGVNPGDIYWGFGANDYHTGNVVLGDVWQHIAAVYDGGVLSTSTVHLYLNGVEKTNTKLGGQTSAANTSDSLYAIGFDVSDALGSFNGAIDDVAIFNRALTPTEVLSLSTLPVGSLGFFFTGV